MRRESFAKRARLRSRKRNDGVGAPPPWYGYLAPATGLAALVVSVLSASFSWNAYQVNKHNRDDTIAPKLTVTEVQLTHPNGKLQDVPILSYQVRNYGTLATDDIHTWLQYRYMVSPIDLSNLTPMIGVSQESFGVGEKLVPGDRIDRSLPLLTYTLPSTMAKGTFVNASDRPSFMKLREGFALLDIQLSTEANDAAGHRIILCDAFEYQPLTERFERRGVCPAVDIVGQFRSFAQRHQK